MKRFFHSKQFVLLGILAVVALFCVGVIRAFTRGSLDFLVFYQAWRLVATGHGAEIYRDSPDRFLYAPGFAWFLFPLGLLPQWAALLMWCFGKAALLRGIIKAMSRALSQFWEKENLTLAIGASVWGVVLVARPLLIDLEYGQVNLFIVGICLLALLSHFEKKVAFFSDVGRWLLLGFVAAGKLFPLPLLLVPWVVTREVSPRKLTYERLAILIGVLLTVTAPLLTESGSTTLNLWLDWHDAVLARGLPMEAHNQSFTALLYHYLSGNPTRVHSEGGALLFFGQNWLSPVQIVLLSLSWTMTTLGLSLGWIFSGSNHPPLKWIAVSIGLLIVPSHLVWKPYFVMSLPLATLVFHNALKRLTWPYLGIILALFVGINLTGFDFIGHNWAAHFEAASILLLMHLLILLIVCFCTVDSRV